MPETLEERAARTIRRARMRWPQVPKIGPIRAPINYRSSLTARRLPRRVWPDESRYVAGSYIPALGTYAAPWLPSLLRPPPGMAPAAETDRAAAEGYQPPQVQWRVGGYRAPGPNVPSWWQPFLPTDLSQVSRPDVAYSLMLNTIIPYLSPEDQVRAAHQLYTMWDTTLSAYKPGAVDYPSPAPLLPEELARGVAGPAVLNPQYFLSGQRGAQATEALANMMKEATGSDRWKLGPGYKWLQDVLSAVRVYGGGKTRQGYLSMLGALDPLLSQTKSDDLAAFSAIGQMLTHPFFSRGQLRRVSQQGGRHVFGAPNPLLMW